MFVMQKFWTSLSILKVSLIAVSVQKRASWFFWKIEVNFKSHWASDVVFKSNENCLRYTVFIDVVVSVSEDCLWSCSWKGLSALKKAEEWLRKQTVASTF